ncbi:MAG: hypothetical protein R3C49_08745 [Planctomycetaceae bacterium]
MASVERIHWSPSKRTPSMSENTPLPHPPVVTHHDDRTELEKALLKLKLWAEENATTLIYGLAAILAVAAVLVYINRIPGGNVEASRALLLAVSPEDYRDVADQYGNSEIGRWARLRQGDRLLDNAVTNMFSNRKLGVDELAQAEAAYNQLADTPGLSNELRERVLTGLARVQETRCDGSEESTAKAIAGWQRIVDEFSNSLVKDLAEDRIKALATDESKAFYTWFQAQNPSPIVPGTLPGQSAVPDVPDMTIPGLNSGDEKPADEKPADEKPADEKPADEKPADEKPADTGGEK